MDVAKIVAAGLLGIFGVTAVVGGLVQLATAKKIGGFADALFAAAEPTAE